MTRKKICMLGDQGVGKTSLVQRFVTSRFPKGYQRTVGVMIDQKTIRVDNRDVYLMLWDIYGEEEFRKVQTSYLKDASGIFIVVDGTRRQTLDTGLELRARAEEAVGIIPSVMVFNKWDLKDQWKIDDKVIEKLTDQGMAVASTSAKTGRGVEDAFLTLTRSMLKE